MKRQLILLVTGLCLVTLLSLIEKSFAGNPLVTHVHSADPSAHVWPGDDRVWIYASHDEPGTNTHHTMASYHVFSSTDLVNWVDYGRVLHVKDVSWAASHAWAIDAALWKGTYYLVYCMQEKGTGIFRTGLAISPVPQGPFTDIGFIQGIDWGQDPALFVDDDETPYLFWGCGGGCFGAQLTEDLKSVVPGTMVDLKEQLFEVFEGPWVHKYQGKYYLTYPGLPGGEWPENMYYAIADKPLGPYKSMGKYMPEFEGRSGTNHGSVIQYQGKWIFFYHSAHLSGGKSECRNLMADFLDYNDDGTIKPMSPTKAGVAIGIKPAPSRTTILLEAEHGKTSGGELLGTAVGSERAGFSGPGYVFGFDQPNDRVTVLAQVAKDSKFRLKIGYAAAQGDQEANVLVRYIMIKNVKFPQTDTFTELDLGIVELKEGDNLIHVLRDRHSGNIEVDYIKLEQILE